MCPTGLTLYLKLINAWEVPAYFTVKKKMEMSMCVCVCDKYLHIMSAIGKIYKLK